MNLVGPDVYLMDQAIVKQMPCGPQAITCDAIGKGAKGTVALNLISFSKKHGAWCGVGQFALLEKIRKANGEDGTWFMELAIQKMVENGLLVIPRKKGFRGWFSNLFSPKIIYPTPELIRRIFERQKKSAEQAG